MEGYEGTSGYVPFDGEGPESKKFTLWHKTDDPTPLRHVYVQQLRIDQEPLLEWVPQEGRSVEGGYMVPLSRWNTRIDFNGKPV